MDSIMAKLPPQSIEAEQSCLGSLLIDKDAIFKVADILRPEDFYKDGHQVIFECMLDLFGRHEPIDLLSLSNRLADKNKLDMIGGRAYLSTLSNMVPTASHVVHYANIVQRKATLRRLIRSATTIAELGYKESEDVELVLDSAERSLFDVSQRYLKQAFVPIKSILGDAFDRIDSLHTQTGSTRGVPSGFKELDNLLAGFQRSDLIILAARPSVGKTSLALDFGRQVAVKAKVPVGIFSLEMSKEQLVDRLLCAEAGIDLWKMRTGRLGGNETEGDFERIGHAMGLLSEAPIFIDDSPMANVMEMRAKARRLKMEHGLGLLIVDYLQLMEGRNKEEGRVQEVSEITRALKGMARELDIPVLALSQLNRSVETRTPPIPKLADLRESGSIEQDADIVMFIYREDVYKNNPAERNNLAEVFIAKHRNGPTGKITLFFDEKRACFRNIERNLAEAFGPMPMDAAPPIPQF
ncbi:replicative DNA helicase [Candidatus Uhrbacteria bacterium]|nr:replicative DNA helicase [Candidatus Uhrbacteria bacterium]